VDHQNGRYARLRYTATGALAALAAAGAIAGTVAVAANPRLKTRGHTAVAKTRAHAAVANGSTTKTPTPPVPGKTHAPQPGSDQPFLTAVQQLVNDGTISTTEGQALDREIQAGSLDTQTLASSGFTPTQLQAVEQTLENTKRALAPGVTGAPRTAKAPPPSGTGAPGGRKEPLPAAAENNSTPK
jgi:hypothetical protein